MTEANAWVKVITGILPIPNEIGLYKTGILSNKLEVDVLLK